MTTETVKRGAKLKAFITGFAALTLAFGNSIVATSAVQAADIGAQLTDLTATIAGPDEPVTSWGEFYKVTGRLCVPDSAQAGDTWSWQLPELISWPKTFKIMHAGQTVIDVAINDSVANFTLTPAGDKISNLCANYEYGGQLESNTGLGEKISPSQL